VGWVTWNAALVREDMVRSIDFADDRSSASSASVPLPEERRVLHVGAEIKRWFGHGCASFETDTL
jgi:hypothetical protein